MSTPSFTLLALLILGASHTLHADDDRTPDGPLDLPLPDVLLTPADGEEGGAVVQDLEPAEGVVDQESLVREVRAEQEELEQLPRAELEERAEDGERGAQVALGDDFAREAEQLAFSPAAANDALSDAVRWYSLAASRGYPGAPALDQAGVSFFPIRVQRTQP